MGYYIGALLMVMAVILQNSVFTDLHTIIESSDGSLRLITGQPELVIMLALCWAWQAKLPEAFFWAIFGAILQDIVNPIIPTGISAMTLVLMVLILKTFSQGFYELNFFTSVITLLGMVAVATLIQHLLIFGVMRFQGYPLPILETWRDFSLPTLGYNLALTPIVYWVLRRIQKRLPREEITSDITA